MALPSNLYAFKVQTLEYILAQTAAPNVLEWPSYGNFREKKCKGGTKGTFSKIAQKDALVLKAQNHSRINRIIL